MKRLLMAVLLTAVLLAALSALLDLSAEAAAEGAAQAASRLSAGGVGLALALYALSYVGRGGRLAALLPARPPLALLVSISARHNLLNLLLPLRSGEASLPIMLKSEAGRPLAEGAAALVVARVLDLISVAAWLLLGLALIGGDAQDSLLPRSAAVGVGLLLALLCLKPAGRALARTLQARTGRIARFAAQAGSHLAAQPAGALLAAAGLSLITWLCTYGACFVLLADMAGPGHSVPEALAAIDFQTSLVGSTVLHLSGILPVNTLAGIGPWEAGWTAGYMLVGLPQDAALASAVVSHGAILAFVLLLGGLGWLAAPRLRIVESAGPAA